MRLGLFAALFVLLPCCSLVARDIYVNNEISHDAYDGTSPVLGSAQNGPLRTISRALRLADKGDHVILAKTKTPYRESITLQASYHSGTSRLPFRLIGNGAVLDGTRPIPASQWRLTTGHVFRWVPPKRRFAVVYLNGEPADRLQLADKNQLENLKPKQWCLLDGAVYFRTETGRLPTSYKLSYAALPVGITLYQVRHLEVTGLEIRGFQLDGVNAHDGVTDTRLAGLTCRGNGRAGISVGGASRVQIDKCQLRDNGVVQFQSGDYSHTVCTDCDIQKNVVDLPQSTPQSTPQTVSTVIGKSSGS